MISWLVFDLLRSSSLSVEKAACLCRDLAVRCTEHTQADTQRCTHRQIFSLPFRDTAGGLRDTVSYTRRQSHTHKHKHNHLNCSTLHQSIQRFSRKRISVNISPLHTNNCVYFHLEFQPDSEISLKDQTVHCLLRQDRVWVAR